MVLRFNLEQSWSKYLVIKNLEKAFSRVWLMLILCIFVFLWSNLKPYTGSYSYDGRYVYLKPSEENSYPIYISESQFSLPSGRQNLYLGKLRAIDIENGNFDFWSLNTQQDMYGDFFLQIKTEEKHELPFYPKNKTDVIWSGFNPDQLKIEIVDNGIYLNNKGQWILCKHW